MSYLDSVQWVWPLLILLSHVFVIMKPHTFDTLPLSRARRRELWVVGCEL